SARRDRGSRPCCAVTWSTMYPRRQGFSACSGLSGPSGSHQRAAIASKRAISSGSTVPVPRSMSDMDPREVSALHDQHSAVSGFGPRPEQARRRGERTGVTTPRLYPQIEPYSRFRLEVGDGHELYCELCGNPDGKTAVVLHGGPGAGCSPFMRRFFDPRSYRIVLFDQRGAGKSTPSGGLENNTTWDLVHDLEKLREH